MNMQIKRIDEPYVFEFSDSNGNSMIMDSSADLEGQNRGMTPMQVLLGSLMGCMSIDIILVLKKQKISPKITRSGHNKEKRVFQRLMKKFIL